MLCKLDTMKLFEKLLGMQGAQAESSQVAGTLSLCLHEGDLHPLKSFLPFSPPFQIPYKGKQAPSHLLTSHLLTSRLPLPIYSSWLSIAVTNTMTKET